MKFIPILLMIALFALGVPIVFSMLIAVMPYLIFIDTSVQPHLILQRMVASIESTSTWAIPFFIMAGAIMTYSGISRRLMNLAEGLVGHLPGGLAQVNVLLSTLMGGISGSAAADAATECKILVPEMTRHGYDEPFSAAVTAASSLITPVIPPGVTLIIFACVANVSIGKMFVAGYVPGIIMCVSMMILVHIISKKHGYKPSREKIASGKELWTLTKDALWALLLPFGLILAIRFGVCTATEGGALCAVYSFIIGAFVYKELKPEHIWPIIKDSVCGTATVVILLCAANAISWYMSYSGVTKSITEAIFSFQMNRTTFMLITIVLYLILGMFIEGGAIMIMIVPILLAPAVQLGIDPVQFGIIMVMMSAIGALTPPFGIILYLVAPLMKLNVMTVAKACMPFIILLIGLVLLFAFIPGLVTFVPNLVFG